MTDLNKIDPATLLNAKKIHFIGIGGIGISAIARMMHLEGKEVTGNDLDDFPLVIVLKKKGIKIDVGQDINTVPNDSDLIVYSLAWEKINPTILEYARNLNVPVLSYPQMLGVISKQKKTIAVAGTHGKTTTTAMIAQILIEAKKNPTVVVGSLIKGLTENTNFIAGTGELFVAEACEYKRSFLNLYPYIGVITNLEEDHLDYYKDLTDIQKAFSEFTGQIKTGGFVVCNPNDEKVKKAISGIEATVIDYTKQVVPKLAVIGRHNQMNAKAAKAVAEVLGIESDVADKALVEFKGTWRRMEFKGQDKNGNLWYDDYAHHPTEIKSAIGALREEFPDKKIIVAFQPHLYSRTKLLLDDFVGSFNQADLVLVADIYAAREINDESIHSKDLVLKITENGTLAEFGGSIEEIGQKLKELKDNNSVIVTMGAGDIHEAGFSVLSG